MSTKLKKFSDRKVGGKQLILPYIAIAMFLLVTGGVSYAYFTFKSVSTNNTSYMNTTFSPRCNKAVTITKTDCGISYNTVTTAPTTTTYNDAYVSSAERLATYKDNQVAKSTCSIVVTINGCALDSCTYNVKVNNVAGSVYTPCASIPSGKFEYSGTLSAAKANASSSSVVSVSPTAETQMNTLANTGTIGASQKLIVNTTDTAATATYTLVTRFYNIDAEQSCIQSATADTTFRHQLYITDLKCFEEVTS